MWSLLANAKASRIEQLASERQQHQHAHHQLLICLQGNAYMQLPALKPAGSEATAADNSMRSQQLAPGQGCLVPSQCLHAFHGDGDNRQIIIDISNDHNQDGAIDARILQQLFSYPRFFELDQQQQQLIQALAHEIEHHHHDLALQQHASGLLLHSLYHRLSAYQQPLTASQPASRVARLDLQLIDQLILQHLSDKLSVEFLAHSCHMSVSQFHLRFRQLSGMTPHQYVMQQRLNQAVWLLQNTSLTVATIAADTGFSNQSALNHAIKARYQLSPGQLRKNEPSQL